MDNFVFAGILKENELFANHLYAVCFTVLEIKIISNRSRALSAWTTLLWITQLSLRGIPLKYCYLGIVHSCLHNCLKTVFLSNGF